MVEDITDNFENWGPAAGIILMIVGFIGLLITLLTCTGCFEPTTAS